MRALLLRRLATALPTLAAVLILSFVLMRLAPGGPFCGGRAPGPAAPAPRRRLGYWPPPAPCCGGSPRAGRLTASVR